MGREVPFNGFVPAHLKGALAIRSNYPEVGRQIARLTHWVRPGFRSAVARRIGIAILPQSLGKSGSKALRRQ